MSKAVEGVTEKIEEYASLTKIGLAAPVATIFGIVLNVVFYIWCDRKDKAKHDG